MGNRVGKKKKSCRGESAGHQPECTIYVYEIVKENIY